MSRKPIRLGMIGAGLFARDAHVPSLNELQDHFEVVAIYSRTAESANQLAKQLPKQPQIYTDMSAMLDRDDIEAVDILLPINLLPTAVEAALGAGKHVISEKPIAPTVLEGEALLQIAAGHTGQAWMVAENWRYEDAFVTAKSLIEHGEVGDPMLFHWAIHIPMTPDSKYYHTNWRRDNLYQGGYVLDGGVHHIAGLRMLFGEVNRVSALASSQNPDLPPIDTLTANLEFDSGVIGAYVVSYSATVPWKPWLHIVGTKSTIELDRDQILVSGDDRIRRIPVESNQGVKAELEAFAHAIWDGTPHRNDPAQALQDVAVVEAMLQSAEHGKHTDVKRIV